MGACLPSSYQARLLSAGEEAEGPHFCFVLLSGFLPPFDANLGKKEGEYEVPVLVKDQGRSRSVERHVECASRLA